MSHPEPKPCARFRNKTAVSRRFIRHVIVEKCPKCLAVLDYLQRQSEIDSGGGRGIKVGSNRGKGIETLKVIELPERSFVRPFSHICSTGTSPPFVAFIQQEFDKRKPQIVFVTRLVLNDYVAPVSRAPGAHRMEMRSQAINVARQFCFVQMFDHNEQQLAILFELARNDGIGYLGNHPQSIQYGMGKGPFSESSVIHSRRYGVPDDLARSALIGQGGF